MRWLGAVLACAALAGCGSTAAKPPAPPAAPSAVVVGQHRSGARLLDLTIRSPALGDTAKVRLLLPDRGKRPWPVLYLLHGCCDTYVSWTRSTAIERMAALRRVLVVMPDGGDVGFYSDWRDGPRWETFHTRELPALLAQRYGAASQQSIAGLSMGGLGAIDYAARHPRMYRAAASFSGVLHPLSEPRVWLRLFAQYTDDPHAVWGNPKADRDVWAAHDPTELAGRLHGVRLFVSAGDGRPGPLDPPRTRRNAVEVTVGRESHAFARRLRRLGIPARIDFYGPGTHDWPYWERELHRALPTLLG
jgi:diacylglycerol O-acyltransferase / trehalose O-mycolyltransferase